MGMAIEKAKTTGVGIVFVRDSDPIACAFPRSLMPSPLTLPSRWLPGAKAEPATAALWPLQESNARLRIRIKGRFPASERGCWSCFVSIRQKWRKLWDAETCLQWLTAVILFLNKMISSFYLSRYTADRLGGGKKCIDFVFSGSGRWPQSCGLIKRF